MMCADRFRESLTGAADARRRRRCGPPPALLLAMAALLAAAAVARADDTLTLPRGVGRMRVRPIYSFFDQRWDQDGRRELLTGDLDNRNLNSEVFPDLSILERLYGAPAGSLSLGTTQVKSRIDLFVLALAAEYGITDRITVGLVVPIVHARHRLRQLELVPTSTCTSQRCGLGKNLGDTSITVEDSKYLPLDHDKDGGTKLLQPLVRDDVQDILADDLGYQRLADWSGTGIGDLELGVKVQLLRLGFWTTALQAGVRLPTGSVDDPENLLDIGFGDGQTDLGFYWQNDFQPAARLRLNLTLRYTVQLPDHERKRVPPSASVPLAKPEATEEVWRDLGDHFEVDLMASYQVLPVLIPFVRYAALLKVADEVRGNRGLSYRALMDETAQQNHLIEAGLSFSTIPWVQSGRFRLPLDATLTYSRSLAGLNNAPVANVLSLELSGYFKVF